jgi:hypothetical protein
MKEQFFSKGKLTSDQQKLTTLQQNTLKHHLKQGSVLAISDYIKTLSPSGIELEFMSLGNFDIADKDFNFIELMLSYFHT